MGISVFLILGCSSKERVGNLNRTVYLKNGLGQLEILLPQTLDTSYNWTSFSDYKCGHLELFRFADKDFSLNQESGFVYSIDPNDSILQITISQPKYLECQITNDSLGVILNRITEAELIESPNRRYSIKEVRSIGGRKFAILGYEDGDCDRTNIVLKATTLVKGQLVSIVFNSYSKRKTMSLEKMDKSLNTLKISTTKNT